MIDYRIFDTLTKQVSSAKNDRNSSIQSRKCKLDCITITMHIIYSVVFDYVEIQ